MDIKKINKELSERFPVNAIGEGKQWITPYSEKAIEVFAAGMNSWDVIESLHVARIDNFRTSVIPNCPEYLLIAVVKPK